jgi:hypothetical protein
LVLRKSKLLTGDLTVRFFHRSRTTPERFAFRLPAPRNTTYDVPLASRLGEYRKLEVALTSKNERLVENVILSSQSPDGRHHTYFEKDIAGDGHDWSAPLGGRKKAVISLPLVGASFKQRWSHRLHSTNVVIESYFQGYEIWPDEEGIGYANAAFLETLAMAKPGRRQDKNWVSVSLYKGRYTHAGLRGLYDHISRTSELPFTRVKFMLQKYEDLHQPKLRYYRTDQGIMTQREKTMMHNKFVLVKKTAEGPVVTTSSANWSTYAHGRWQASTRIAGVYDLWLGYQRYFDNLFKYDPRTNLADIDHSFQPKGYWSGTPNLGKEFSEAVACPSGCEGEDVHEYAQKFDIPEIALGPLKIRAFFFPRDSATRNSPMKDEFANLRQWLDDESSRRAEVYVMHLSQRDVEIYREIHKLHAHPRADVKVLVSLKDSPDHMHTATNVTGLDAKFSPASYEVHSKNVQIKKWHLEGGRAVPDSVVVFTGSYNMIESTLTDRDENLLRIEWTDRKDPTFEQLVYRPHLDQLMRAWNQFRFTKTVGKPPQTSRPAERP